MPRILFSLFVMFFASLTVQAQESVFTSQIGDKTVLHPSLAGFQEVHTLAPGVFEFFEGLTPDTNKLLAAYITDDDYQKLSSGIEPALDRYLLIQTIVGYDNVRFGANEFDQVKTVMKSNLSVDTELSGMMQDALEEGVRSVEDKNDYMQDLSIEAPTVIAMGRDSAEQLSFTILMDIAVQTAEGTEGGKIVYETALVRASDHILYVYVYEDFNGGHEWVQSFGDTTAQKYIEINQNSD